MQGLHLLLSIPGHSSIRESLSPDCPASVPECPTQWECKGKMPERSIWEFKPVPWMTRTQWQKQMGHDLAFIDTYTELTGFVTRTDLNSHAGKEEMLLFPRKRNYCGTNSPGLFSAMKHNRWKLIHATWRTPHSRAQLVFMDQGLNDMCCVLISSVEKLSCETFIFKRILALQLTQIIGLPCFVEVSRTRSI